VSFNAAIGQATGVPRSIPAEVAERHHLNPPGDGEQGQGIRNGPSHGMNESEHELGLEDA